MNKTLLSSFAYLSLFLALPPRSALAIEINTNSPAPAVVDMEDSADAEDEDDGCGPPSANDGPNGDGSPCEKNSAPGMAAWRVSEPYINLWLDDTPLRYRLAGGKWMELTLSYKQRGETREEFIGGFGPGWSCNWLGLVVRSNSCSNIFLHKAGGGREISDRERPESPDTGHGSLSYRPLPVGRQYLDQFAQRFEPHLYYRVVLSRHEYRRLPVPVFQWGSLWPGHDLQLGGDGSGR